MITRTHLICIAAAGTISSSSALAAPIDLTINPALSSLDTSITIDVSVASSTDSASSTLSGNMEIELDDAGNPTSIILHDLMVVVDQSMNFDWSFGLLGSADAVMSNGSVSYASPGLPTGPVPLAAGSFDFPEVFVNLGGQLNLDYSIFIVGSGSELVNMADQGSFASPISGDVTIVGETITVSTTLPLNTTQPFLDSDGNQLGTVTTAGTATIVATGFIPSCPADLNGDGALNFFDVSAFLNAFAAMDLAADFNGDGMFNFFDVSAFLNSFGAGCP